MITEREFFLVLSVPGHLEPAGALIADSFDQTARESRVAIPRRAAPCRLDHLEFQGRAAAVEDQHFHTGYNSLLSLEEQLARLWVETSNTRARWRCGYWVR